MNPHAACTHCGGAKRMIRGAYDEAAGGRPVIGVACLVCKCWYNMAGGVMRWGAKCPLMTGRKLVAR